MSFIPTQKAVDVTIGNTNLIAITDSPLSSAALGVLEQSLHMAGTTKIETPIIALFPHGNLSDYWIHHDRVEKRMFTPKATPYIEAIKRAIDGHKHLVVVTMGDAATKALLGRADVGSIRGYPFPKDEIIVIPALHPQMMVWSNYIWRYYLSNDLRRARAFADGVLTIDEPKRIVPSTFGEAVALLESLVLCPRISFDIEVSNYEVSCIGLAVDPRIGFSIPIDDRWSEEEEIRLWLLIASLLEDENIIKVCQNGIFDIHFLAYKNGIIVRGPIEDTMIAHSVCFPDFLKGLGFLGSVHTTMTYWKDEMDHRKVIKKEA